MTEQPRAGIVTLGVSIRRNGDELLGAIAITNLAEPVRYRYQGHGHWESSETGAGADAISDAILNLHFERVFAS